MPTTRSQSPVSGAPADDDAMSLGSANDTPSRSTRRSARKRRRERDESDHEEQSVTEEGATPSRPKRVRRKAVVKASKPPALPKAPKNDKKSAALATQEKDDEKPKVDDAKMEVEEMETRDVDMGEAQSKNDSTKTNGIKENLMNGDIPMEESSTAVPVESTEPSSAESVAAHSTSTALAQPEKARLRMPSQHTPGKPLRETKVLREPVVDGEENIIDLPSKRLDLDMEPTTKIVPERKPSTLEQTPMNGELHHEESNSNGQSSLLAQQGTPAPKFSFSRIAADLFSPGTMGRPMREEMEETEIVDESDDKAWSKNHFVLFGILLLTQLALSTLGVGMIRPTAYLVRGLYFAVLGKTSKDSNPVVPNEISAAFDANTDPSMNYSLIEEKLAIRDSNILVAQANREVGAENAKREGMLKRRQQQIVRVERINEHRYSENEKIDEEEQELRKALRASEQSKLSLENRQSVLRERIMGLVATWEEKKSAFDSTMSMKVTTSNEANESLEAFQALLQQRAETMEELMQIFEDIAEKEAILESRSELDRARELLDAGEEEFLLDVFSISLWKPRTPADCTVVEDEASDTPQATGVSLESAETMVGQFKRRIIQHANEMKNSQDLRLQIEELLEHGKAGMTFEYLAEAIPTEVIYAGQESNTESYKADSTSVSGFLGIDEIEDLVLERMHTEWSDGSGKKDFASLANGGKILGASPSLVDNLPVVNRLQSLMGVNSYGFGPEAALTPTWPPNSLGQCWAFERDRRRSKYNPEGVMAGLLVQLTEPIQVGSVSIEHPPPESTDKPNSAIKAFRVFGFEEADASGLALDLGSFTYDIWDQSRPSRQEFAIAPSNIPKLAAVELAIDSNWGAQVSCLYRFRVHEKTFDDEEEEED